MLLSISVDINWAENGYRICSFVMGLFTMLMVVCSIVFAVSGNATSIGIIFLIAYVLSYLIPLIINFNNLKISDFLKGIVYAIYLSPTYVNILTIYAISNIHDVTWGSRVASHEHTQIFREVERKKSILYRNFRANFLIFWIVINVLVAEVILEFSADKTVDIIFYLGAFLILVMVFKVTFSTLHMLKARCDRWRVNREIRRRKSEVFKGAQNLPITCKEDIFVVYFDEDGNDIRMSTADDPNYKNAQFKSAVKDRNTIRGFNLR